mmetsp:Transcript_128026/g.273002  ORF Transcript_128026/g.273002 Transcript_128026/m.273002 type:complete len:247 (+) Transcript_128026:561-1301(+)
MGIQGLLAGGAGRCVEKPQMRLPCIGLQTERLRYCRHDMVQVPPQVHLQLHLPRGVKASGAERQSCILGALLLHRHRRQRNILRCGVLPGSSCRLQRQRSPMAIGNHAINAERLATVVQGDAHVNGIRQVCCKVGDIVHGIHRHQLLFPCPRRGLGSCRCPGNLAGGSTRCDQLPDDHVARPELLILDRSFRAPGLDVPFAKLLPALPSEVHRIVWQGRYLFAADIRAQTFMHPTICDHDVERIVG